MDSVSGHGAVDLEQVKTAAAQKAAMVDQREALTGELLHQAGLQCRCGERIRSEAAIYFAVVEGPVQGPQGPQIGLNLMAETCCSRTCSQAIACEQTAIARRDGLAGRVTWLDERRAARLRRTPGQ